MVIIGHVVMSDSRLKYPIEVSETISNIIFFSNTVFFTISQMDGRMDGRTDRQTDGRTKMVKCCLDYCVNSRGTRPRAGGASHPF